MIQLGDVYRKAVYSVKWDLPEGVILITPSVLDWMIMHTYLFSFLEKDYISLFNDLGLLMWYILANEIWIEVPRVMYGKKI